MLRWKPLCLSIVGGLLIIGSSGCSMFNGLRDYIAYNDACNDFVIGYRNEIWAEQSWHENKHCFADQPYLKAFGEGYEAGYIDVASGGSGCPPVLPPRCYWSWHYQSPEGQAKVAAWYAGFPHGAATAERDNAGGWQEIQVSHQLETQYSPEFEAGTIFLPDELLEEYNLQRPCCQERAAGGSCSCGACGAGAMHGQDPLPDQRVVEPGYESASAPPAPMSLSPMSGRAGNRNPFAYHQSTYSQ